MPGISIPDIRWELQILSARGSMAMLKSRHESASPCLTPLRMGNGSLSSPFIITVEEACS